MRVEEFSDGMVDVGGSVEEFEDLAALVARGEGRFETEDLVAVEVRSDAGPRLLVKVDEQRRVLLLRGA
ncbi:hypothetical protein [Nocardia sp. CA-119907]|uniref:hypothetical protein n=1 Tax=Nocardia sp. CA-119907 TaxID=3239973 RepID=UPI003D9906E4